MELTLFRLNEQHALQKALENLPDMEHVFFGGAGEDEDVINVDKDKTGSACRGEHPSPEPGTQQER